MPDGEEVATSSVPAADTAVVAAEPKKAKKAKKKAPRPITRRTVARRTMYAGDTLELVEYEGMESIRGSVLVEGFPSASLTGIIAANFLAEALELPVVGVVCSTRFPARAVVDRGQPAHGVRILGDGRVCVMLCEFKLDAEITHAMVSLVADVAARYELACVCTLESLPTEPAAWKEQRAARRKRLRRRKRRDERRQREAAEAEGGAEGDAGGVEEKEKTVEAVEEKTVEAVEEETVEEKTEEAVEEKTEEAVEGETAEAVEAVEAVEEKTGEAVETVEAVEEKTGEAETVREEDSDDEDEEEDEEEEGGDDGAAEDDGAAGEAPAVDEDAVVHFLTTERHLHKALRALGHDAVSVGVVDGLTGGLLAECVHSTFPLLVLLVPAMKFDPGAGSAVTATAVLAALFEHVQFDLQPLLEKAQELKNKVRTLMNQQMHNAQAQARPAGMMYS